MTPEVIDPTPLWLRQSTWAAAAGYLSDAVAIIALVADVLPPEKALYVVVVGNVLSRVQATFSRIGGVNAAKRAAEANTQPTGAAPVVPAGEGEMGG